MKILFYCQHLLGIGHVSRSLHIVEGLSAIAEVTYVQGGPPLPLEPAKGVRKIQLSPLLMREADNSLYDPNGEKTVEQIFAARAEQLKVLREERFDLAIFELYPFGRKKFSAEISALIQAVKEKNPKAKIVSSVRDILVAKEAGRNDRIVVEVKEKFDEVWVHSDPAFLRLEESFPPAAELPLQYTGFVAAPNNANAPSKRLKKILVSLGGGAVGHELFRAAAAAAPAFAEYRFHFVFGPYAGTLRAELEAKLGAGADYSDFLHPFEEELGRAALSLSLGGYNTVMNLLQTRTPALVLAFEGNGEQRMRAERLERAGYLKLIEPSALQDLAPLIRERLSASYPESTPDLGGVARTAELALRLRPKKIAFYAPLKNINHPNPSGDRQIARGLHRFLGGKGEVFILSDFRARFFYRRPFGWWSFFGALIRAYLLARREKPDLFFTYHSYHRAPDLIAPLLSRWFGKPYVIYEGMFPPRKARFSLGYWLARFALSRATIFAINERDLNGLAARYPAHYLPPCFELGALGDRALARGRARLRLKLGEAEVAIFTVAMLRNDRKSEGVKFLVDALGDLKDQGVAFRWFLLGDGPEAKSIAALARQKLGQGAELLGKVDEVASLLVAGDLYAFPGWRESFGLSFVEAMGLGLPVVAFRGDWPALAGEGALCTPPLNRPAYVAALRSLVVDPALRQKMGRAGEEYVAAHFGMSRNYEEMWKIINR